VSCNLDNVAGMAQSVEQFATDWTGEGANSGESVIFRACSIGTEVGPASCRMSTGFLTGGGSKAAGGGVDDQSRPYRTDVK
jgi:hypothetical protein